MRFIGVSITDRLISNNDIFYEPLFNVLVDIMESN